jgi:hypothetical protein
MEYFFLKLGHSNREVEDRLSKPRPEAVVYFDGKGEKAYERGDGKTQPRLFWERAKEELRQKTVMVVIHHANVWLLQPDGKVRFGKRFTKDENWRVTPKVMPVKILAKLPSKFVPPVLASMACNQQCARRTFTKIPDWGNLKAIDYVLQCGENPKSLRGFRQVQVKALLRTTGTVGSKLRVNFLNA